MPAKSQAQRAYLNMKFGHDWVKKHGFDNTGPLPAHVGGGKMKKKSKKKVKKAKGKVVDYSGGTKMPKGHRSMGY